MMCWFNKHFQLCSHHAHHNNKHRVTEQSWILLLAVYFLGVCEQMRDYRILLDWKMYQEICLTRDTLFLLVAVRLPSVFTEPLKICMINLSRVRFRAVLHRRETYVISPGTCEQNKKQGWKKVLELKFHITVATTSQGPFSWRCDPETGCIFQPEEHLLFLENSEKASSSSVKNM